MTDSDIIAAIIAREGGYVDNPADAGGPTNFGITQQVLAEFLGRAVSPTEVRAITEAQAAAIYQSRYITQSGFDQITDPALRAAVVDTAVNFGVTGATKMLQSAVGVTPDGLLGPRSVEAIAAANAPSLLLRIVRARVMHRASYVKSDPSQLQFLAGWLSRDLSLLGS